MMMRNDTAFGGQNNVGFQVSVSTLTLGTLYESILAFSSQETLETFWPAVCGNARWLIPSRRLLVLLCANDHEAEIVGKFEQGKFAWPENDERWTSCTELHSLFKTPNARWIEKPGENFREAEPQWRDWLFRDEKEMLFLVPIRTRGETLGVMMFVTGGTSREDQAMLNTLGTIYALHTGMTYEMIRITEDKRQMQSQLMMQEKMATLGNLAAGVAHEVNNPIGAINSAADVVTRSAQMLEKLIQEADSIESLRSHPKLAKAINIISKNNAVTKDAGQRIAKIVKSLKNFAQLDEAEYQMADIREGVESTLTLVQREIPAGVNIITELMDVPEIHCNMGQLNQAFMHLILNALDAVEGEGEIRLRTFQVNDRVCFEVSDSGVGIALDKLEKIFEPGFTEKGVGVGVGLGLPICRNIVRDHNGEVDVRSTLGEGSVFAVKLPVKN